MADGDLMSAAAAPQASSLLNSGVYPSSNGFDFGMSQPKTGLGYGLLGDLQTLQANMGIQDCGDCPPDAPCPTCQDQGGGQVLGGDQAQIIKAQAPMPLPGLIPPPPAGLLPPSPSGPVVIGDPNAWWNWTPGEVGDWLRGIFESRPSKAAESACEAQVNADLRDCQAKSRRTTAEAGPDRGARELDSCTRHAWKRYSDCLKNNGKTTIPPYPDWYEDPPYPDDYEDE